MEMCPSFEWDCECVLRLLMIFVVVVIQCSNLMLIESVPGEPLSFHVIPFDNPRLQCTLQVNNIMGFSQPYTR